MTPLTTARHPSISEELDNMPHTTEAATHGHLGTEPGNHRQVSTSKQERVGSRLLAMTAVLSVDTFLGKPLYLKWYNVSSRYLHYCSPAVEVVSTVMPQKFLAFCMNVSSADISLQGYILADVVQTCSGVTLPHKHVRKECCGTNTDRCLLGISEYCWRWFVQVRYRHHGNFMGVCFI